MTTSGSITHWICALKGGDQAAAQPLWERYHARLIGVARQMLRGSHRRQADEEDVVQNAFKSFFHGVAQGRFPRLDDRDGLWRLLVILTARKAIDQVRRERRHGSAHVASVAGSAMIPIEISDEAALEQLTCQEATPALAAQLAEQHDELLARLADDTLRQIAIWKLEGFANGEIGVKLGCSRRTVIRKLETIRLIWTKES